MPELHLTCPVCQTQVDKDYPTHLNSKTQAPLVRDLFEGQWSPEQIASTDRDRKSVV